jgi:hypothetical protein
MTLVTYAECDHCGNVVPQGGVLHTAQRREYNTTFGNYSEHIRHLCCSCYQIVGGTCDEYCQS